MRTRRVMVLEPLSTGLDADALREHGDVVLLFGGGLVQASPSVFRTEEYVRAVRRALRENRFDPRRDVFALTGRLTKIAMATGALLREFPDDPVRVLIYDGSEQRYVERAL